MGPNANMLVCRKPESAARRQGRLEVWGVHYRCLYRVGRHRTRARCPRQGCPEKERETGWQGCQWYSDNRKRPFINDLLRAGNAYTVHSTGKCRYLTGEVGKAFLVIQPVFTSCFVLQSSDNST